MGTIGKRIFAAILVAILVVPVLFEVSLDPQFALPRTVKRPDAAQEQRYSACVDGRTDEATRDALAMADNPDVQSLMIRMRQKEAVAECRIAFPEIVVEVDEPLRIKLLELRWRFQRTRQGERRPGGDVWG